MSRRKGWDSLSTTTRRRYERAGVSRSDYESGVSLTAARGHAATPERPERAQSKPDRYRRYLRSRERNAIKVVTEGGVKTLAGLSKAERSRVGAHDNALRSALKGSEIPSRYLSVLSDFEGETVTGYEIGSDDLETFTLATDHATLEWLESTGQLRFDSIYPSKAA